MADKVHPINIFLYQLTFSIPILLAVSCILEPQWIYKMDTSIIASILYQSIIVAFMSCFIWFKLKHTYTVSRLSAFTFFISILGVFFGEILFWEKFTLFLTMGLAMVSL